MTLQATLNELHKEVKGVLALTHQELCENYGFMPDQNPCHYQSNKIMALADEYSKDLGGERYNWSYQETMAWIKLHCLTPTS